MAETQPVNPSPKSRFMASEAFVKAHRALIDRDELQRGLDFALAEYNRQLCEQRADLNMAAASHFRSMGALEFCHVLKTLAESTRVPTPPPVGNLNHHA